MSENFLYPSFLNLEGRKVLIVGGSFVAYQKVASLLETKAKIIVIAPSIIDEIYELDGEFPYKRYIDFQEREYQWGDEKDCFMVIAATNLKELNLSILNRCKDQNILVCSVDHPNLCDFFVPSIAAHGDIKVAVSSNGKAPGIAQGLRKIIQNTLLESFCKYLPIVTEFRKKIKDKYPEDKKRHKLIRQFTQRQMKKIEKELELTQKGKNLVNK
jgi:precorrin-2 dehydrogenase/sirohydrochlorin ferrochelatase